MTPSMTTYESYDKYIGQKVYVLCPEEDDDFGEVSMFESLRDLNTALSCVTPGVDDIKVLYGYLLSAKTIPENICDDKKTKVYIIVEHNTRADCALITKFTDTVDMLESELEDFMIGASNIIPLINEQIGIDYLYLLVGHEVPLSFAVDPTSVNDLDLEIAKKLATSSNILEQIEAKNGKKSIGFN